jgi:hypothetical protein
MDPVKRVADFLRDNVGHLTRPGNASYDVPSQHFFVPIRVRTERGEITIGDVEVDCDGHIVYSPSREELDARLQKHLNGAPQPTPPETPVSA